MSYSIEQFPTAEQLANTAIYKKLISAHRYLAELKGVCRSMPNQAILINTLILQEAKDSSEIENIITTHDELFREAVFPEYAGKAAAKEVQNYTVALRRGYELLCKDRILTNRHILAIQEELERNRSGFRKLPGTELKNDKTGQTVYQPPQHPDEILRLMGQLERFINEADNETDPLIRMAVIHHRFESIHPFYDGNGRTGRIINVLYLVLSGLLDIPVLYLSRYLVQNKSEYYRLLQYVRDTGEWHEWVLYMLTAVEQTAQQSITIVSNIREAMQYYKHRIRDKFPFYSQDLINHLFCHPYTKIDFAMEALAVSRPTASKYLDELTAAELLFKQKLGKSNYYINLALYHILIGKFPLSNSQPGQPHGTQKNRTLLLPLEKLKRVARRHGRGAIQTFSDKTWTNGIVPQHPSTFRPRHSVHNSAKKNRRTPRWQRRLRS